MTKIKVVGALIFVLSILLAILSNRHNESNHVNNMILNILNEQKDFTQEISKNIFYVYKNKNTSEVKLNEQIQQFVNTMNSKNIMISMIDSPDINKQNKKIVILWNKFYLYVQNFRDKSKITTLYSNLLLENIVKDVYNTNLALVVAFNELADMYEYHFQEMQKESRNIEYSLFLILLVLSIYLFTQIKLIIAFIQKFLHTSKNIITNSSIKDLEYIEVSQKSEEIDEAANNFNFLVDKINHSIEFSTLSIENTYKSLEVCEANIEELLELLSVMEEDKEVDKELIKKEDALILSLEELSTSAINLKNLKSDLKNLISTK